MPILERNDGCIRNTLKKKTSILSEQSLLKYYDFFFGIIVCLLESFQITLNDEPHPPILQRGVSLTSANKQRLCHIDSGLVMLKIN